MSVRGVREWTIRLCPRCGRLRGDAHRSSCGVPYRRGGRVTDVQCEDVVVVRREERDLFRQALGVLATVAPPHVMTRYRERMRERPAHLDGAAAIADERLRQLARHDEPEHLPGDLLSAAVGYSIFAWWQIARDANGNPTGWTRDQVDGIIAEQWWPFDATWWKPSDDPARNLAKAGALIAAEHDRTNSA